MSGNTSSGARLVGALKILSLVFCASLVLSCARFPFSSPEKIAPTSPFSLSLKLNKAAYQPGEAVICGATLTNNYPSTQTAVMLNFASLTFSSLPVERGGGWKSRIVTPVSSEKESPYREDGRTPWSELVGPGKSITRPFVFTTLTAERGEFLLQAMYQQAAPDSPGLTQQTLSELKAWNVAGDRAFVERYVGGLLTKDEAIRLARAHFKLEQAPGEAMLIKDEMGFLKWWVNLLDDQGAAQNQKSCFVDPYLARIWNEARPFTAEHKKSEVQAPDKTTILDKLRDKQ